VRESQENFVSEEPYFDAKKFGEDIRDQVHKFKGDLRDQIRSQVPPGRRPVVVGIHLGNRCCGRGMFWGVILTLFGLGLLLDHMGIISIDRIWRFWPLLLIVVGVFNLRAPERRFWGVLLILGGAFFQFRELGLPHFGWVQFWPLVFIAIGLLLMWNALEGRKRPARERGTNVDLRTTLDESVVFGGIERRITTQDFQGGRVNAVFGGVEIDLTEANMQSDEATLEINAVFGGVELRLPYTWQVAFRGSPIFGGITDKTRTRPPSGPNDPKPKILVLTGSVVFGGIEVKN
jgi:predicted membrane protein